MLPHHRYVEPLEVAEVGGVGGTFYHAEVVGLLPPEQTIICAIRKKFVLLHYEKGAHINNKNNAEFLDCSNNGLR